MDTSDARHNLPVLGAAPRSQFDAAEMTPGSHRRHEQLVVVKIYEFRYGGARPFGPQPERMVRLA